MNKKLLIGIIVGALVVAGVIAGVVFTKPNNDSDITTTTTVSTTTKPTTTTVSSTTTNTTTTASSTTTTTTATTTIATTTTVDQGSQNPPEDPPHTHTEVIDAAVSATCTAEGLTEGKHCSACGDVIVAQTIVAMLNHTYDNDYDRFCNVCNYERQIYCRHDVPEKIVLVPAKDPTCQETGLTEGMKCTICDTMVVPQIVIPTIDCIAGNWIVDKEVTKTEDGKRHTDCIMCGTKMAEEIIPATGSIGLTYSLNDDGQSYSVTGIGTCDDSDIVILDTYCGLPVTSVGDYAFANCKSITSITIPSSISYFGREAFVYIGKIDVYYLGNIEDWLNIEFCSFTNVPFLSNPLWNGSNLYLNGELVTELAIPNTVAEIKINAFVGCGSLTSVVIGDLVTSVADYAFYNCTYLRNVEIGDSVTSIGNCAFSNCTSLTSIDIPDSVTSIGPATFDACYSLIEVINKSSLNIVAGSSDYGYVGYYAKYIIANESQSYLKYVGDYVFYDDGTDIYLVKYLGSETEITLPQYDGDKEYEIWSGAFSDCTSLTSIEIPDIVTSIGASAFRDCTSLTSIVIPDSVTSIGGSAFSGCTSLTSIEIPDSVTRIGDHVFSNCTSLTSIEIPNSVTSIGEDAFYGCTTLTIYCEATSKPSGWYSSWNSSNRPVVWGYTGE